MIAIINIQGIVGEESTLLGVIRQFKSYKNPSSIEVIINSNGGSVEEGMSIYSYLRKLNLPITTKTSRAYSIAASIFMAGDVRLIEEGVNRFMIHMPLVEMRGGSKMIEKVTPMLKQIEDDFTKFYSKFTDVDEDSVRRLLENETFLSSQEAVEMGIATGTYSALKAVAFYKEEKIKNNKEKTIMNKVEKLAQAFASFLEVKKEVVEETPEIVALILQDANGEEINFPDLAENEQPEVGSKVEGREDGEILMPDGSKIIVVEGEVKEIVEATKEEEVVVEEEASVATEEQVQAEAKEQEDYIKLFADFEKKITDSITAKFEEKEVAFKAEITALKKEVGSELENEPVNVKTKPSQSGNYLTNALRKKQSK